MSEMPKLPPQKCQSVRYSVNKKMEGEKKSGREVELYLGSQLVYAPEVEFL